MSKHTLDEGTFMYHEACEACGSSDAKAVYSNGSAYCFSCDTWFPPDDNSEENNSKRERRRNKIKLDTPLLDIQAIRPLKSRRLSEETCRKYGYGYGVKNKQPVQIAPYFDENGNMVAQHIRTEDKQFFWRGSSKGKLELFGQHLWRVGGKRLVITEGEIDCLTIAQVFNLRWATVSVPNGAKSAVKYIKYNLDFVESYDEVVLAFDNDEAGRQAVEEVAQIITPGKLKVANFHPYKDASEMQQKGKGGKIAGVIFEAKEYRPDGIIEGEDIPLEDLKKVKDVFSFDIPYPYLNKVLRGIRKKEITTIASGTGMGKTTLAKEIVHHLVKNHNLRVGVVALEEPLDKSALSFIAIDNDVPLGDLWLDRNLIPDENFEASYNKFVASGKLVFYDHFGSLESTHLLSKLKFLAAGADVDFILFDHISIAVSGLEDGDERRLIDNLMTKLRSIVEATGVGVILISHLRNPQGNQQSHEEGGRVEANQLRGSGSIKHISDSIIGVERNQQGETPNIANLRVLKNRLFGTTGLAGQVEYNPNTGRLLAYNYNEDVIDTEVEKKNPFKIETKQQQQPEEKEEEEEEKKEDEIIENEELLPY